jgi:hypothetical protein
MAAHAPVFLELSSKMETKSSKIRRIHTRMNSAPKGTRAATLANPLFANNLMNFATRLRLW